MVLKTPAPVVPTKSQVPESLPLKLTTTPWVEAKLPKPIQSKSVPPSTLS